MFKSALNYLSSNAGIGGEASGSDFFDEGGASGGVSDHIVGSTVDVGGTQVHGKNRIRAN